MNQVYCMDGKDRKPSHAPDQRPRERAGQERRVLRAPEWVHESGEVETAELADEVETR